MSMRKNEAKWVESRQRWQINVQNEGERKTFLSSTPGKKGKIQAEKKADKWLESHLQDDNIRIETLLDRYYEKLKQTTSKSHYVQYDKYIRLYAKPVIGKKRISKLTKADLQSVIDKAYNERHLAKKTLENIRGFLMSFLKYCRDCNATTLFVDKLTIPRGASQSNKQIIYPDELPVLFGTNKTSWRGREVDDFYINAYRFAVLTGIRPGELIALENRNINGNRVIITNSINDYGELTDGKNDNARRVFVLNRLEQKVLEDQRAMLRKAGCISRYVFPDKDLGPMTQQSFRRAWQRYCAYNGIEHALTPYEMRHTFVSINDEMPEGLKKMVVGHSRSMDTEGTYGHEKKGDLKRASEYSEQAFLRFTGDSFLNKK